MINFFKHGLIIQEASENNSLKSTKPSTKLEFM